MANIIADIHKWDTWHLNIGLKREFDYFFQSVTQTRITDADFSFILLYFFYDSTKNYPGEWTETYFQLCSKQTFGSQKLEISILECVTEFEDDVKWYSIDCNVEIASRMGVLGKKSKFYQLLHYFILGSVVKCNYSDNYFIMSYY